MPMDKSKQPITFIDSNCSGLSALRILHRYLPHENYSYLMDTQTAPFADKSPQLILEQGEKLLNFAATQNSKALVLTSFEMATLFSEHSFSACPCYNFAELVAQAALTQSQSGHIAIIGSPRTLNQKSWLKLLNKNNNSEVHFLPTPLLLPIIQEQLIDDPLSNLLIYRYINPVLQLGVDTMILADTSYSWIQKSIQKVVGDQITLIEGTELLVQTLTRDLNQQVLPPNSQKVSGHLNVLSSDPYPEDLIKRWLRPVPLTSYETISL